VARRGCIKARSTLLFERLVAKGNNKKLALIAVCNKLLKQAFAIIKSGVPYQADFSSKLARIS
jgi:transposase